MIWVRDPANSYFRIYYPSGRLYKKVGEKVVNDKNVTKRPLPTHYTGRFIMFSVITNIYNKKTKGPTLMELLTATGKLKKFFFYN